MPAFVRGLFAIPLLALVAAAPSGSHTVIYYHAGGWEAFSGTGNDGRLVCGISTFNRADGRTLAIRFPIGGDELHFQATRPGWSIPAGTAIPVTMQIGPAGIWNLNGTGHDDTVEWTIGHEGFVAFDTEFRRGVAMLIGFPSGNEVPWNASLVGSNAIGATFARCIADLTQRVAQPLAGAGSTAGPTQPFSAAQPAPAAPPASAPGTPAPSNPAPSSPAPSNPAPNTGPSSLR